MIRLASYYVRDLKDLVAHKDNIIVGPNYRFTILTERLIRLEYSPYGEFEDRASQNVIFRNFPKTDYSFGESATLLQITTKYFVLDYVKGKSFVSSKLSPGSTLKVTLKDTDRVWYYGHPEARNFGSMGYSLDQYSSSYSLEKGLYSTDGFAVLDDSFSYVVSSQEEFVERKDKCLDIYLFMYRKDFGLCLKDYFELTGYPMLISRYALGNLWLKNDDYRITDIQKLMKGFGDEKISISGMLLGDKWHDGVNTYSFSKIDCYELTNYLKSLGVHLGIMVDPSLEITAKSSLHSTIKTMIPGISDKLSFLPYDMQKMNVYLNIILRNLLGQGVEFFGLDYNNIKDRRTMALYHHYQVVGAEAMLDKRGLNFVRNTRFSVHRNAVLYTGKTMVNWKTLEFLPYFTVSASNLGVSWVAHALGGYYGGTEDRELFWRYVQLGTFSPIFLLANEGGKYYKREPWKWDALCLKIVSEYMQLRNKLIPYLYSEAYVYHKTGAPLVQPMYYQYPRIYDDPFYNRQYFFGSEMLVCPIVKKKDVVMNRVVQRIFVPEGIWYDFRSGKKYPGNKYYLSFYKDEDYPVYCKAGSIIPLSLDVGSENPVNLEFQIFPGDNGSYKLYEDDGISNGYKKGNYVVTAVDFTYTENLYTVVLKTFEGKGNCIPSMRNYFIRFRNVVSNVIVKATYSSREIPTVCYIDGNDLVVRLDNVASIGEMMVQVQGEKLEVDAVRILDEDILSILMDLEIDTSLKEKIDKVLFSDLPINKKRIAIRKLKRKGLSSRFIKMFINLFEYMGKL